MRSRSLLPAAALLAFALAGCGPRMLKTKGRLVKNGEPFRPAEGEMVRVMFVPLPEGGGTVKDFYMAQFNPADGTFQVVGKDLKGMPPGKYRIAVEHLRKKRDLFGGAFDSESSPFVREVRSSGEELVLDLGDAPARTGAQRAVSSGGERRERR
jgi:ABC-type iron transport system FetAB ATPase subunit